LTKTAPRAGKVLDDGDVATLFGLETAQPRDAVDMLRRTCIVLGSV